MLFDDLEGWDGRRGRRLKREGIYKLYISIYIYLCGEGNGNPLQYSCLEKPVDRGAWWADVHGVAQSWTQLKRLRMHACMPWRRNWQPTPVFLPGESQGQRSLVGCRLWGRTESDMTEVTQQQHIYLYVCCIYECYILLYGRNQHNIVKQFSTN